MRPVNDTWVVVSVPEKALEERKKICKGAEVSIHRTKVRVVHLMDSFNKIQVQPVMQLKADCKFEHTQHVFEKVIIINKQFSGVNYQPSKSASRKTFPP